MRITRVFFNGDCYLALRAEMDRVNGNKLILWTPDYLDHLFQPFLQDCAPLPLALECENGETLAVANAVIDFHGEQTVNDEFQMEIRYDNLSPADPAAMPRCAIPGSDR